MEVKGLFDRLTKTDTQSTEKQEIYEHGKNEESDDHENIDNLKENIATENINNMNDDLCIEKSSNLTNNLPTEKN